MRTKIMGVMNPPSASSVAYAALSATSGGWAAGEGIAVASPCAGAWRKFRVNLTVAPGIGRSRTVTLRKNYVDTALTVTISDNSTTGVVEGNVTAAQGDLFSLVTSPSGSPAAAVVSWCADFQGAVDGQAISVATSGIGASSIIYIPILGNQTGGASAPANETLCSVTGTISNLTISLSAAVASSRTFTLRKNGVNTSVVVSLGAGATGGSDNVNSVSVAPGDRLVIVCGGAAQAIPGVYIGLVVTADTDGYALVSCGTPNPSSASATNFLPLCGSTGGWSATESPVQHVINACTLKRLDVQCSAPGAGNSKTFSLKVNGVATALQVVISDAATTGNAVADVVVADGDLLSFESIPFSSPSGSGRTWFSYITFELNPATGRSSNAIFFH